MMAVVIFEYGKLLRGSGDPAGHHNTTKLAFSVVGVGMVMIIENCEELKRNILPACLSSTTRVLTD